MNRLLTISAVAILLPNAAIAIAQDPAASASRASDVQDLIVFADFRPLFVRLHVTVDGVPFLDRWRRHFDKEFNELDRDSDGMLSKDEAARAPLPDAAPGAFIGRAAPNSRDSLAARAAGASGMISREAFLVYYESSGAAALSTRTGAGRSRYGAETLALIDTDRDGRVSANELKNAEASLRRRDYDDDEIVADQELAPDQNPLRGFVAVDSPGRLGGGEPSALVFVIRSDTTPAAVADALVARYDQDKNGSLSIAGAAAAELRLTGDAIAELDRNFDGVLDRDELGRFAERSPDVEVSYELGANNRDSLTARESSLTGGSSPVPVRRLAESTYLADAGDSLLEFRRNVALANAPQPQVFVQAAQNQFQGLDSDKNGYLEKTEVRNPLLLAAFPSMDRDGDDKVSRDEFNAYNERLQQSAASRVTLEVTDDGQQLLELLDRDRDGRLTLRELRAAASLLDQSDTNRDGFIAGSEIPRRLRFELTRGSATNNQLGRAVVFSGAPRPPVVSRDAPPSGPVWFRKMDRNRDGDLSPREFLGSREDFDRLDSNHDGLIDLREADSAGK